VPGVDALIGTVQRPIMRGVRDGAEFASVQVGDDVANCFRTTHAQYS
jgi:hypothetical protein